MSLTTEQLVIYLKALNQHLSQQTDSLPLVEGPLNKSVDTRLLENWLNAHYADYADFYDFRVGPHTQNDASREIWVYQKGTEIPVLNLTLLLSKANLSQLTLDGELKHDTELSDAAFSESSHGDGLASLSRENKLTQFFEKILHDEIVNPATPHKVQSLPALQRLMDDTSLEAKLIKQLPKSLIYALILYTQHQHANELILGLSFYRGESKSQCVMVDTMVACLGAQALQQLQLLYSDAIDEIFKKIKQPENVPDLEQLNQSHLESALSRGFISAEEKDFVEEYLQRPKTLLRRDNELSHWLHFSEGGVPTLLQSPVFVSTSHSVSATEGHTMTITPPPAFMIKVRRLSGVPAEEELLLPPGTQLAWQMEGGGNATAKIINSPTVYSPLDYTVAMAVRHAWLQYLSKPYADVPESLGAVERPNHGLAHTMRQLFYIEPVIDYFSQHAVGRLKQYCKSLLPSELELIKLAMVFSATGRESEYSFRENPEAYQKYRQASAEYFRQYVESLGRYSLELIDRFALLVLDFGNPNFSTEVNVRGQRGYHPYNNAAASIMTFAHGLDLMRCYQQDDFERNIEPYVKKKGNPQLVKIGNAQQLAAAALVKYAEYCLVATHDYLMRDTHYRPRDETFAQVSVTPSFCDSILRQVPTPEIRRLTLQDDRQQKVREFTEKFMTETKDIAAAVNELEQKYRDIIGVHPEMAIELSAALVYLKSAGLLRDSKVYDLMTKTPAKNILTLAMAAAYLQEIGEFNNRDSWALIASYPEGADQTAIAINKLKQAKLLNFSSYKYLQEKILSAGLAAEKLVRQWSEVEKQLRQANLAQSTYLDYIKQRVAVAPALALVLVSAKAMLESLPQSAFISHALSLLISTSSFGCELMRGEGESPSLIMAILTLRHDGLYRVETQDYLLQPPHSPLENAELLIDKLQKAEIKLNQHDICDDRYIELLKSHPENLENLVESLIKLQGAHMLDANACEFLNRNSKFSKEYVDVLIMLQEAGQLNDKTWQTLKRYSEILVPGLKVLLDAGVLDNQTWELLAARPEISLKTAKAIQRLKDWTPSLWNAENYKIFSAHARDPDQAAYKVFCVHQQAAEQLLPDRGPLVYTRSPKADDENKPAADSSPKL